MDVSSLAISSYFQPLSDFASFCCFLLSLFLISRNSFHLPAKLNFFFWCFVLVRNGEEVDKYQHSETGTRQMTFQSHCILSLQDRQDWFDTVLIPLENAVIGTCVVIYMLLISTSLLVIMFLPERFVLYFAFKKKNLSLPHIHTNTAFIFFSEFFNDQTRNRALVTFHILK